MSDRRVIFFDFDGVLVSTFDFCLEIERKWQHALTPEEYRKRFEGNVYALARAAMEKGDRDTGLADPSQFFKLYTPELLQRGPVPGMDFIVRSLAASFDLAIVSATVSSSIREFLNQYGLKEYFFDILGGDVSTNKTDKIEVALEGRGLDPSQSLLITDTLGDVREAQAAGVASIAVTWGYHDRATLQKGSPFAIVEHPAELEAEVEKFFG